jgi:ABC-type multidrug transport system fused ATPase/permease subunit
LLKALYRLADYTGTIKFSDHDSKLIKLEKLRSSLSIIPQEPYLFRGTIRQNLDPHGILTDDEICRVFNRFGSFFNGIEATVLFPFPLLVKILTGYNVQLFLYLMGF